MVEFTVAALFDNIEKNGLPQTKGHFFASGVDNGHTRFNIPRSGFKIGAACALGQASINLGIDAAANWRVDDDTLDIGEITGFVLEQNDYIGLSFKKIAKNGRKKFAAYLDRIIKAEPFDYSEYV